MEWRAQLKQTKANELNEDREGVLFTLRIMPKQLMAS